MEKETTKSTEGSDGEFEEGTKQKLLPGIIYRRTRTRKGRLM